MKVRNLDWFSFTAVLVDWAGFTGSLLLSLGVLALVTVILFSLFRGIVYEMVGPLAGTFLANHRGLVDTVLNLIAGLDALLISSWLFERPPNAWDLGIQALIILGFEAFIFFRPAGALV